MIDHPDLDEGPAAEGVVPPSEAAAPSSGSAYVYMIR